MHRQYSIGNWNLLVSFTHICYFSFEEAPEKLCWQPLSVLRHLAREGHVTSKQFLVQYPLSMKKLNTVFKDVWLLLLHLHTAQVSNLLTQLQEILNFKCLTALRFALD